jgi:hypothetical protein
MYSTMKKIILLAFLAFANYTNAIAQDENEVMLFSQYQSMSTARSMALGGAMGSIGADFAAMSVNPAALGKYSKGEFAFTPTFRTSNTTSTYDDKSIADDKTKLAFDNLGIVLANRKNQKSGWKATNFAFGFNRVANFNRNFAYSGTNFKSSMVNQFAQAANAAGGLAGLENTSLLSQMAFSLYLMDTAGNDPKKELYSFIPVNGGVKQYKNVSENGGIHEMNFSLAANNNDQLLLGASVGVPILHYSRKTNYLETDNSGNKNNDFDSWEYTETLKTNGAGINLKVGAIYMPVPYIRIGGSLHSPTYYQLTEEGNNVMSAKLENFASYIQTDTSAWKSVSEYGLSTPFKAILSGSVLMGKYGFVTADYEYLDYKSARINTTEAAYNNDINTAVKKIATTANNIRLGAEFRANEFSLRAGYAMFGSQLNASQFDASRKDLSLGAGYRGASFFTDIAWVNSKVNDRNFLYQINGVNLPNAQIKNNINTIVLTIGWKFE